MCLAVPGRIVELRGGDAQAALVDVEGVPREVSLGLVVDSHGQVPGEGSWVLVHLGFALAVIEEAEALAALDEVRSALSGPSDG